MTASVVSCCPHDRLTRDTDPDYGYCLRCHHTVFTGTIPNLTLLRQEPFHSSSDTRKDMEERRCADCGKDISPQAKRCQDCSRKVVVKNLKPRVNKAFGAMPIVKRHAPDFVTSKKGTGY